MLRSGEFSNPTAVADIPNAWYLCMAVAQWRALHECRALMIAFFSDHAGWPAESASTYSCTDSGSFACALDMGRPNPINTRLFAAGVVAKRCLGFTLLILPVGHVVSGGFGGGKSQALAHLESSAARHGAVVSRIVDFWSGEKTLLAERSFAFAARLHRAADAPG